MKHSLQANIRSVVEVT